MQCTLEFLESLLRDPALIQIDHGQRLCVDYGHPDDISHCLCPAIAHIRISLEGHVDQAVVSAAARGFQVHAHRGIIGEGLIALSRVIGVGCLGSEVRL